MWWKENSFVVLVSVFSHIFVFVLFDKINIRMLKLQSLSHTFHFELNYSNLSNELGQLIW